MRSAMPTGSRVSSLQPLRVFTVTGRCVAADHGADDPLHQIEIAQTSRAAVPLHDLLDRAAEVDVDELRLVMLGDERGRLGHRLGIGAVDLDADRALDVLELGALERIPDPAADGLGREELREARRRPPCRRQIWRNGASDTPAIGARMSGKVWADG